MKNLISGFLSRPISVLMLFAGVLGFGFFAAFQMPVEFYPDIEVPSLLVSASYPGVSGENTRQLITVPLEDALSSLPGLKSIESVTRPGNSMIELQFQWGSDMLLTGVQVREILDSQYPLLPDGAQKPKVLPFDPNQLGLLTISVEPVAGNNLILARRLAEREIRTELQQAEGVGSVILVGGKKEEVLIETTEDLLVSRGLSIKSLAEFIQSNNLRFPAGTLKQGTLDYVISTDSEAETISELSEIQLAGYTLENIASVRFEERERRSGFFLDNQEAVGLIVRNRSGENPVKVAARVVETIERLNIRYGNSVKLEILENASSTISEITSSLFLGLILGAAVAFFVILFFLRSIRLSFIVLSAIPFSLAATFLGLSLFGVSLNSMTLGGLALGIGMLVDTSVVVIERIKNRNAGSRMEISQAVSEVSGGSFASTITSIIVFAPIFFLPGLLGSIYRDLALAIILSLSTSFLVSISLVPVLFLLFRKQNSHSQDTERSKIYAKFLPKVLRRPALVLFTAFLLIASGLGIFTLIPLEFSPKIPNTKLSVHLEFPENTELEWIMDQARGLARFISNLEPVERSFGRVGGEADDIFYQSDKDSYSGRLSLVIQLKAPQYKEPVLAVLSDYTENLGARLVYEEKSDPLEQLLGLSVSDTQLLVQADDWENAQKAVRSYQSILSREGIGSRFLPKDSLEGFALYPKREEISRVGLSSADLAQIVFTSVEGSNAGVFHRDGLDYPIRVSYPESFRNNIEWVKNIKIPGQEGRVINGRDLYDIFSEKEPARFFRINRKDSYLLIPESGKKLKELSALEVYGQSLLTEQGTSLVLILIIAFIILYLFLGSQFESFSIPVFILSTIPVTFPGIALALYLTGHSLNIQSGLGILVLLGLVVNNAILLIEQLQLYKGSGADRVVRASVRRLRPILITGLTTILALVPTAAGIFGASPQQSLAISVIGGLAMSTAVSLILVPVLLVFRYRRR
jgi:HAE1 family hydrophobic/amphiphilic exporter-1